jgi:hypothetical protein
MEKKLGEAVPMVQKRGGEALSGVLMSRAEDD